MNKRLVTKQEGFILFITLVDGGEYYTEVMDGLSIYGATYVFFLGPEKVYGF